MFFTYEEADQDVKMRDLPQRISNVTESDMTVENFGASGRSMISRDSKVSG